jgi:molybdopterin-guanine dinucleotide biosynthesis protein A
MGGSKPLALFAGAPLYVHGLQLLSQLCQWSVLLGRFPLPGAHPCWWEHPSGTGPLTALLRALEHSPTAWNLVLAVDYPELRAATLLSWPLQGQAVLPQGHPLCGFYHRSAAPLLRRAWEAGERSVLRALEAVDVRWVEAAPGAEFLNVNRPEDLHAVGP